MRNIGLGVWETPTANGLVGEEGFSMEPFWRHGLDEAGVLPRQILAPEFFVAAPNQLPIPPHARQLELARLPVMF